MLKYYISVQLFASQFPNQIPLQFYLYNKKKTTKFSIE